MKRKEDEVVYKGCQALTKNEAFVDSVITSQEYKENGFSNISKFYLI